MQTGPYRHDGYRRLMLGLVLLERFPLLGVISCQSVARGGLCAQNRFLPPQKCSFPVGQAYTRTTILSQRVYCIVWRKGTEVIP